MPRPTARFWAVVAVFASLNAAGIFWIHHDLTTRYRPRLRILSALPVRDVDDADRFTLVFDEPIVHDEALGRPLDRPLFDIEPAPAGRWEWAARDKLEYVLSRPLPPGRVFRIHPATDLESLTGRRLSGDADFQFKTRPLDIRSCLIGSEDRTHANIELHFNQPVQPDKVLKHVTIRDPERSESIEPSILTRDVGDTMLLRVAKGPAGRVQVRVEPGLLGVGAELGLASARSWTLDLNSVFTLLNSNVDEPGLGEDVTVELRFTRELAREQPVPDVTLEPAVPDVRVHIRDTALRMQGRFLCGRRYSATVASTVLAQDGATLLENQRIAFEIPERRPTIRFAQSRGILSPKGNLTVDVEAVNAPELTVDVSRVHANNLVAHLRGECDEATSREVINRKIPLDLKRNEPRKLALELAGLLSDPLGVYRVGARATDGGWTSDETMVTVTNLAITAKRQRDGLFVWVTSLRTAQPVSGAVVTALTYTNQTLASSQTNSLGIARLDVPANHPDGQAWLVTAEREGDLAYVELDRRQWVIDDCDSSGRDTPETYDVLLYTERGVYRPGDTIHLTGIVRDASGETPPRIPLAVNVRRPDGRKVATLNVHAEANAQGVFQLDYTTADSAQTGRYRLSATLPGSDDVLGETTALVEAFAPVRMELTARPTRPRFGPGEKPAIHVQARYLFDQPAAGLPVEIVTTIQRVAFHSKRFGTCVFHEPDPAAPTSLKPVKATLDDTGQASSQLDAPTPAPPGLWQARAVATVTEPGGRSVSDSTVFEIDTAGRHIGLQQPEGTLAVVNVPFDVRFVQVTGADELAEPGPVEFALDRVEYDNALQKVDGEYVWKTTTRLIPAWRKTLTTDDPSHQRGTIQVTCPEPGRYRLSVTDCKSGTSAKLEFHATRDERDAASLALNRAERLEVVLDADQYVPGAMARVLVRSPFAGTMLLTLEADRVVDERVVEMTGPSIEQQFNLPADLRGGAFVTASVVRPIDPSIEKWMPHRAMGMARLRTDHSANGLPVTIDAPSRVQPGESVHVAVRTECSGGVHRGVVHLWAVDEGILLTTAYVTPHPLRHFLGQRGITITTTDVFADLLPDHARPAGMDRIGADGDFDDAARGSPVAMRQRAPAVVWRTIAPLDDDGRASADLAIPLMTGEMRLMAVVVDGDSYGSASRPLTVTAPLLVEASWPRFAAPGDRFRVPVKLFNTSEEPLSARVEFDIDGPVQAQPSAGILDIAAGASKTVWIDANALDIGPVTVRTRATASSPGGLLNAESVADFPIRPVAPLHSETTLIRFAAGEAVHIAPAENFLPGAGRRDLWIGPSPTVELRGAVEQLLDYPYGCVEQTTSQLFAILYAPDLIALDSPGAERARAASSMVDAGIARLRSMQTRSGGLGYWPDAGEPSLWGTAYAADFLTQAQRAGYKIDAGFADELSQYLTRSLNESSGGNREVDENTRAMICHVVAAFGKPQQGWMARLSERLDRLDIAGRAYLAAAWNALGRKDRALGLLSDDTLTQTIAVSTGGRITSQIQQEAVLLSVLLDVSSDHPWIPVLVRRLDAARKQGHWGSTLETAAALAALARYQLTTENKADFKGDVDCGADHYEFGSAAPASWTLPDVARPIAIESAGEGTIYATVTTSGRLRDESIPAYDRQLRARRAWLDRAGKPIEPEKLRVGDLVRVRVTLDAPGGSGSASVQNVAIVDVLPGGTEVDNPRLATSATSAAAEGVECDTPDRVEFRDDRVVLFVSAGSKPRVFEYTLRAIAAGSFTLPPIQASCMYDDSFASIHGAGHVEIAQ